MLEMFASDISTESLLASTPQTARDFSFGPRPDLGFQSSRSPSSTMDCPVSRQTSRLVLTGLLFERRRGSSSKTWRRIRTCSKVKEMISTISTDSESLIHTAIAQVEDTDLVYSMRLALDTREPPIPIQPEDVPNPEPSRDHDWSRYAPYTNVLWLWHLIVVLQRNRTPDALKEPALDDTAGQDITPRRRKRGEEVAAFVNGKLRQLEAMLDPTLRPLSPVFSASDLVVWALDNQWLEPEDVQEVDSPRLRYDARLRPPDERNNTYQFDENEKPLGLPRKGWNDE